MNSVGCDSIVGLSLQFFPTQTVNISATKCIGSSYSFGGKNLINTGVYYDSLFNRFGCDSIVILNLTDRLLPNPIAYCSSKRICEGDSIQFSTDYYNKYLWSNGETTRKIYVKTQGSYNVKVTDGYGCQGVSNTIGITVNSKPTPIINSVNNMLETGNYLSYQWYLNGSPLSSANGRSYTPKVKGNYKVLVTDSLGCEGMSNMFSYIGFTPPINSTFKVFPNPTTSDIYFEFEYPLRREIIIYDIYGKLLSKKEIIANNYHFILDVNFCSGMYIFVIKEDRIISTARVLKQ